MIKEGTLSFFQKFFIIQCFFCICRYYLINGKLLKQFSVAIFFTIVSILITAMVLDLFIFKVDYDITNIVLNLVSGAEVIVLINEARKRKTFEAFDRLDEKCGVDDEYCTKIKTKLRTETVFVLVSGLVNFCSIKWLQTEISTGLLFSVATVAHDTEMDMISLMIETINVRLAKLKELNPSVGSRVYRHVLLVSSQLGEEFNSRILLMLFVIQIKTVIYIVFAVLFNPDSFVVALLMWHEVRSLYSLWMLCLASSSTKTICNDLLFHLATRLVLDPNINKVYNHKNYNITRRWYKSVIRERPRYMSGALQTIDLNIPLAIFDTSINYLLIIVQVYAAYK